MLNLWWRQDVYPFVFEVDVRDCRKQMREHDTDASLCRWLQFTVSVDTHSLAHTETIATQVAVNDVNVQDARGSLPWSFPI